LNRDGVPLVSSHGALDDRPPAHALAAQMRHSFLVLLGERTVRPWPVQ
jgi:hypothetical protein